MEVQRSQIAYPTLDRLGNLPAVILDDILSRLPIKEAVKTSILSKEWQYKWTDLSKLVFDGEQMVEVGSDRYHFAESIYLTLQSHSGHISNFKLKNLSDVEVSDSDIDNWIQFVTMNNASTLKRLTLECGGSYEIPPCLYNCQQLTHLHMLNIILKVPQGFEGFKHLVCLILVNFGDGDGEVLTSFVRECPALERLCLQNFNRSASFTVKAPKLKYLLLLFKFQTIYFKSCPQLEDLTLVKIPEAADYSDEELGTKMVFNLFHNRSLVTGLVSLVISGCILQHLRARDIPKSLFAAPNQLRKLAIHSLSLRVRNEAVFALTMLDLFQNIHHLHIKFLVWEPEELFEIEDPLSQSSCVFKALRTVKIAVKGDIPDDLWHPEIEFFKFLLALSPVLEGIDIEFDGEGAKMFKKLCKTELSSYQYGLKKLDVSFEEA